MITHSSFRKWVRYGYQRRTSTQLLYLHPTSLGECASGQQRVDIREIREMTAVRAGGGRCETDVGLVAVARSSRFCR